MARVELLFVGQHLLRGSNLGFHETIDSNPLVESDDDYQACVMTVKRPGSEKVIGLTISQHS